MSGARGFTLLELMITIVIAAVLLTLGVPGMRGFLLSSSRSQASTSLYGAMVLARAEAITRNAQISICQRDFATTNTFPRCGNSGGWKSGWIVYRDSNSADTGAKPYAADDVIAVGDPTDLSFVITSTPANTNTLLFDAAGRVSGATSRVNFYLCKSGDASFQGRNILVELNGHVALSTYAGCTAT